MAITSDFRDWDVQWLTSRKKESPFGTTVGDVDLTRAGLFKGPDMGTHTPEIITDEEQVGRGHEYPDGQVINSWSSELSRQWDATAFWTHWAFAFAMGTDAVVGAGDPFTHTHKFMDENTDGTQMPSATIIEKVNGVTTLLNRKYFGMCVNELTLSAQGKNRLQLSMSLIGNGKVGTNALAIPSVVADEYFRGSNVDFTVGGISMKDYVKAWSLKISNNLMADDGYVFSDTTDLGLYRTRILFGKRKVEFSMTLLAPPTGTLDIQSFLENQTNAPVIVQAYGDSAIHYVKLTMSNYKFVAVPKGSDNNQIVFNVSGTPLFTTADNGPLKVEVNNSIALAALANA